MVALALCRNALAAGRAAPSASVTHKRIFSHVACLSGVALLLAGVLLAASHGGPSAKSVPGHGGKLMRSEPRSEGTVTTAATAAPRESIIRREPKLTPAVPVAAAKERPVEWGKTIRREPVTVSAAAASRPEQWGQYMRKESRPAIVAGAASERPQQWGSIIRREPRPSAVAPLGSAAEQGAALSASSSSSSSSTSCSAIARCVIAAAVLIGFALQVRSMVAVLLKGATAESDHKGKAK